ncbi:hypothetical protein [Azospirillum canadense]|uniref:hypothetical protein n=1 Tax=Azospirillum canadense TaxID=403962 RepID=UPI002227206D|nr:hypothetical protein [Azospirillum canadense]MCW2242486.1 transcriptional regulator of nitric oxide reductase [Azospirillum canadense]
MRTRLATLFVLAALACACALFGGPLAWAQDRSNLAQFLGQVALPDVFPGAVRLGHVEGSPPAAAAFNAQDRPLGYVFMNSDVVNATGYSGKPIHVTVGVDTAGTVIGAKLIKHSEPIVLIGIPEKRVTDFIHGYKSRRPTSSAAPPSACW